LAVAPPGFRGVPAALSHHYAAACRAGDQGTAETAVLYHASISWRPVVDSQRSRPEVLLAEMTQRYNGHVVVGRDLDVY